MSLENIKRIFVKSPKLLILSILLIAGVILVTSNSAQATSNITPNQPLNLIANTYSATQINLSWNPPTSNDGPSLTAYKIVYSIDNGVFQDLVSRDPTVTNYSHQNLMPGHLYTYEVFALNSVGSSGPSNVATQMTTQGNNIPAPPTALSATSSPPNSIILSWNSPQNNGGSPIIGYKIEYAITTNQWLVLTSNTGNVQQTFTHTGIDSNQIYYYRVSAINSIGTGNPSDVVSNVAASQAAIPAIIGVPISPTQISLSWIAPSNTYGQIISGYMIQQKSGTTYINLVANTGLVTSYTISDLTQDTTYTYRVKALFEGGTSSVASADVSVTPTSTSYVQPIQQNYLPAGSAVYTGQQSPSNVNSAVLSNSGPQAKYFTSPSGQVNGIWTTVSTYVNGAVLYFDFNGNTYGTAIYPNSNTLISFSGPTTVSNIRMSIQDRGYSSDTVSVAYVNSANPRYLLVPDAPQGLVASLDSQNNAKISWTAPQNTGKLPIIGYMVEYKTSSSNFWFVLNQNIGLSTAYVHSGIVPGNTYTYRVSAINSIGTSIPSNEASVTPITQPIPQTSLPAGSSIYIGQQSPSNVNSAVLSNSGPQTKYFTSPSGQVNGIWTTVSTYVNGAVLYFDSIGNTYSTVVYPNSNTLISFPGPMTISNVKMSVQDRGYSSDVGSVAYVNSVNPRTFLVPDAPQGLFANIYSPNNVQISWAAPQNIGKLPILGYKVEYKTNPYNIWFVLVQNIGLSTIYVHSGLSPSQTYTYRVSAINSIGTSIPSNEISITTGSFTNPPPPISQISSGMIPIVGTDTSISYVISGGQVYGATVNKDTKSLDFQLQGKVAGQLYVQMPRTLIDAKQSDGSDRTFYVTVDNKNVQFTETKTDTYRTLAVSFPTNSNNLSIVGTTIVPEFPIALIALVIGLVPTIFISRRFGKF